MAVHTVDIIATALSSTRPQVTKSRGWGVSRVECACWLEFLVKLVAVSWGQSLVPPCRPCPPVRHGGPRAGLRRSGGGRHGRAGPCWCTEGKDDRAGRLLLLYGMQVVIVLPDCKVITAARGSHTGTHCTLLRATFRTPNCILLPCAQAQTKGTERRYRYGPTWHTSLRGCGG